MNESIGIILSVIAPENLLKDSEIEIMVDLWQRNYGVPGREPYTTSIDYIQTKFGCCGVERGDEYVTSWWTIRQLSVPGLRVPLSCCIQQEPTTSSQDPQPVNITACQNQQFQIYSISRHIQVLQQIERAFVRNIAI
ncbi:hypothetical protein O3M35_012559 [Rhynocoris fuscipes]|uniref:Uncharacterized protein n=1 Tax=Rhynocoris fuscipes TaxID=488301 RepID=A0AAW1CU17_9HEMI